MTKSFFDIYFFLILGVYCGVGAAYRASLSGIRLISEPFDDLTQVEALTYHYDRNWIYSNSWGLDGCYGDPDEDTAQCEMIELSLTAESGFADGAKNGRQGKGSIFVFAAGNARYLRTSKGRVPYSDDVNYQDNMRTMYVMPIAAYGSNGQVSYYSTPGAALHVSAPRFFFFFFLKNHK